MKIWNKKNRAAERLRKTIIARVQRELDGMEKLWEQYPAGTPFEKGADHGRRIAMKRMLTIAETSTHRKR